MGKLSPGQEGACPQCLPLTRCGCSGHRGRGGSCQPQLVLQREVDVVPLGGAVGRLGWHDQAGVLAHIQDLRVYVWGHGHMMGPTSPKTQTLLCFRPPPGAGWELTSISVRKWMASGSVTRRFLLSTSFRSLGHLQVQSREVDGVAVGTPLPCPCYGCSGGPRNHPPPQASTCRDFPESVPGCCWWP